MKMIFKPLFIAATLSTASLCFAISHAASLTTEKRVDSLQLAVTTQIYPITSQHPIYREPSQFIQVFDKPLIRIPLTGEIEKHFNVINNKNSFFQMATIFNDKLQQFISILGGSEQKTVQETIKSNKVSDRKNCNSAKHS